MQKKRSFPLLLLCIVSSLVLLSIFFFIAPTYTIPIAGYKIGMLVLFFPVLFIFVYSLLAFLLLRKTHGILAATFLILYLLLRINGFTHILFFLLFAALFLIFELFFSKRG